MNLEDYAYNEDGRWYVNPQVSLDEQNAFINNYRNLQAQNNAQIEQQTKALGTQVPSQLGGLIGGGSYFKSRYQTPQTNQTIAELRAVAQQQALSQALNNELAKAKKKYRDAQNNLSNTSGYNATPLDIEDAGGDGDLYNTEYVGTEGVKGTLEVGGGAIGTRRFGIGAWPSSISKMMRGATAAEIKDALNRGGYSISDKNKLVQELESKGLGGYGLTNAEIEYILRTLGYSDSVKDFSGGVSSILGGEQ